MVSRTPDRRALLASVAIAAPAAVLPAITATAAAEPDPHPAWAAEADRLRPIMNAADDDTVDALACRICDLHGLIVETPARTIAGLREQARVLCELIGIDDGRDDGTYEVAAARNLLATLDRLAGRA